MKKTCVIHTFSGPFLRNPVCHIRPSEVIFDLERSENCFLDSENWFLELGILKNWTLEHPNWDLGGFQETLRARGRPPGQENLKNSTLADVRAFTSQGTLPE